jgi:hypothetical protein
VSKHARLTGLVFPLIILGVALWDERLRAEDAPNVASRNASAESSALPSLELPTFSPCDQAAQPVLPRRWRAVGLMSPFTPTQLDVGEFIYDGTLPAMRASIYGLESGAADILITNADTYLLSGPHGAPTGCTSLGPQFKPPSARWLDRRAQCVGEAPIMGTPVQWWKAPAGQVHSTWHWFASTTRLPWRSMLSSPTRNPAIIGDYSLTYFPTFESVVSTNLVAMRNFCRAQSRRLRSRATIHNARDLMATRNEAAETERLSRIETLIPGLSYQACADATPARWPARYGMTVMMTPQNYRYGPHPTELLYDWDGAQAHRTRMYLPYKPGSLPVLDGVLRPGIGYEIRRNESGATVCRPIYPGVIKPDWMSGSYCQCKGVIKNHPILSPNAVTEIRACVINLPQIFWAWYTSGGRPVTFMEPSPQGNGLAIADYYRAVPGHVIPPGTFDLPAQCMTAPREPGLETANRPSCMQCHLGPVQ